MLKLELGFVLIMALLAIGFFFQLDAIEIMPFQPLETVGFSKIMLAVLAIGIIWNIIDISKKMKRSENKQEKVVLIPVEVRKWVFATIALMTFYCLALKVIGYFTTCFIVLIVFMSLLFYAQNGYVKKRDFIRILLAGLLTTASLYIVFARLFQLYLPRGIFI